MMTFKIEDTLKSAGMDTRSLTALDWPGLRSCIFALQTEGVKAVDLWQRSRALTDHTGYWPLIAGEEEHLTALRDNYEMELSGEEESVNPQHAMGESMFKLVSSGESLDLDEWFKVRSTEDKDCVQCEEGAWPIDLPSRGNHTLALTHRYDYTAGCEKPLARIFLIFLPVSVAWQVPAVLRLGGWNKCPQTDTHVAVARAWRQRYGAEIISATNNIVEMYVDNPPKTKDESLKLAREQFLYCSDLIHRRYKTLSALAANLIDTPFWSFWWT